MQFEGPRICVSLHQSDGFRICIRLFILRAASVMQFAGFRSVISTRWIVITEYTEVIAGLNYENMPVIGEYSSLNRICFAWQLNTHIILFSALLVLRSNWQSSLLACSLTNWRKVQ